MSAVLIGMMGVGKSTLGREAASRLGYRFRDLDSVVERLANQSVEQIFAAHGEPEFRRLETEALESLRSEKRLILSVGGGAPMNPHNFEIMKNIGTVIYLRAPAELIVERLRRSQRRRPLLGSGDPADKVPAILTERAPVYEQAGVILDVQNFSKLEMVERISQIARERP